jgi:hypothetical protein
MKDKKESEAGEYEIDFTKSEDKKLVKVERGIAYFEDGWWMHDADRWELERRRRNFQFAYVKRNDKTKQIEIDYTVYP